jgi:hypothetical protein
MSHDSSFTSYGFHHGRDARAEAVSPAASGGTPLLVIGSPGESVIVSPAAGTSGDPLTPAHARFARQLETAAAGYSAYVDHMVGDPDAGAEFWASIDTTPCPCDGGCGWCG